MSGLFPARIKPYTINVDVRVWVQDDEVSGMLQLFNMGMQRPAPALDTPPMGMTVEIREDNRSLTFLAALPGFSRDGIKVI